MSPKCIIALVCEVTMLSPCWFSPAISPPACSASQGYLTAPLQHLSHYYPQYPSILNKLSSSLLYHFFHPLSEHPQQHSHYQHTPEHTATATISHAENHTNQSKHTIKSTQSLQGGKKRYRIGRIWPPSTWQWLKLNPNTLPPKAPV